MVLGICRYHRNSNGWNDIGYNFLVDRYGTIFEGRAGGIGRGGRGRAGPGLQLDVDRHREPRHLQHRRARLQPACARSHACSSWKLAVHGVPPAGEVEVVSQGGSTNRYPGRVPAAASSGSPGTATATRPPARATACTRSCRSCARWWIPGPPRAATQTTAAARAPQHHLRVEGRAAHVARAGGVPPGTPVSPLGGRRVDVQVLGRARLAHQPLREDGRLREGRDPGAAVAQPRACARASPGEPGLLPSSSASLQVGVRPRASPPRRAVAGKRGAGDRHGAPEEGARRS